MHPDLKTIHRIRLQINETPELGQCFNNNEKELIDLNIYKDIKKEHIKMGSLPKVQQTFTEIDSVVGKLEKLNIENEMQLELSCFPLDLTGGAYFLDKSKIFYGSEAINFNYLY